jgi:hypothetical protein
VNDTRLSIATLGSTNTTFEEFDRQPQKLLVLDMPKALFFQLQLAALLGELAWNTPASSAEVTATIALDVIALAHVTTVPHLSCWWSSH